MKCLQVYYLSIQPSHAGQLSLVIPPWIGIVSTEYCLVSMVMATTSEEMVHFDPYYQDC